MSTPESLVDEIAALVAAALLHNVGHFTGAVHGRELLAGLVQKRAAARSAM